MSQVTTEVIGWTQLTTLSFVPVYFCDFVNFLRRGFSRFFLWLLQMRLFSVENQWPWADSGFFSGSITSPQKGTQTLYFAKNPKENHVIKENLVGRCRCRSTTDDLRYSFFCSNHEAKVCHETRFCKKTNIWRRKELISVLFWNPAHNTNRMNFCILIIRKLLGKKFVPKNTCKN